MHLVQPIVRSLTYKSLKNYMSLYREVRRFMYILYILKSQCFEMFKSANTANNSKSNGTNKA